MAIPLRAVATSHGLAALSATGSTFAGATPLPTLRIAVGYSFEAFADLMRRRKALGNRELPLTSRVARGRFSHFTNRELRDLYTYLITAAAKADSISLH